MEQRTKNKEQRTKSKEQRTRSKDFISLRFIEVQTVLINYNK
jgi:hypothetical protein